GIPTSPSVVTANTQNISSLTPNTSYDLYVRAKCGGTNGDSVWKGPINFKTACAPTTSMYEGFEGYATGNFVPSCWVRLAPATSPGGQTITTTTPASGTNNIYQYAATTANPIIVVLPEFSNVAAGTNWLRFKARATTSGGILSVGYVTDVTNYDSFVSIQDLNINNTVYTVPEATYTVVVPNTIPANARLAIKNKNDGKSYYWDDVYWEVIPTCIVPTAFGVSNITTSGATLFWTDSVTPPANGYDIYYSTTSTAPTATTTPTLNISGTFTTLSGLTDNTVYYVWIRTKCSATDKSSWVALPSFKTDCLPVTTMYEGFETTAVGNNVPNCWVRMAPASLPGSQSITTTTPASGVNNLYQYTSTTSTPVIVALPVFSNVNAGTNWLRFKARVTSAGGILTVGYVTDITNMGSFTAIQDLTINNITYTAPDAEYKVVIPTTVPAGARLAIVNKNDGKSYYWDDVYWEVIPTCMPVTNITASNITTTSATISWTASTSAPALGYDVYYSTSSTAPVATTTPNMNVATTTANISSLSSSSTYFVWVRAKCSATDSSSWAAMPSFNTLCDFVNVPYTQNFEGAVVPALPNCTTNQNVGAGNNWTTTSNPGYGFTTKVLYYQYNISNAANTWFYTPGINLQAGVTYKIAFDYGNNSTSASFTPEKLKVAFGTSAVNTAMTTQIVDLPNINQGALQSYNGTFTVPTTGVYYFGWNAYSDANKYYIYVDNISITNNTAGTTEIATKDAIKIYPNPFHEVLNISEIKNVKSVNIIDASGRVVKTINQPSSQLQLGDLASGLYIVNLLHKDGTTTSIKAVKK
ncbi:MAG: fibronectin type III domain-containing protein, partial [Bacteroidetes bacterium]|nr:fibronectin type III domain-containing protein [Bacteroidota bacterium]